ncbi:phage terminase large subunit family protein, partial [Streptomyces roseolus]|uniref:phage terminase large subunit family protein n=1 Tax=Streptomyces roseolus TaxID=67358 RepID=UPI00365F9D56
MAKIVVDPAQLPALKPRDRRNSTLSSQEKKQTIIATVRMGRTIEEGCRQAGVSRKTHEYYRKSDPDYRDLIDRALQAKAEGAEAARKEVPDFPDFCARYLDTQLAAHHLQWYDLLEGRPPRDLHPAQRYIQGDPDTILVNTPPEHAKSTVITTNYVVWRICQDPSIRVLIISKTQSLAAKFLFQIKQRLAESKSYAELQRDFGPPGGWAEGASSWTNTQIRVAGVDSGEKDYTVEAVGLGGQIYGTRTDLVIMDDCVDNTNHQQFEAQIDWIQNIVGSRVADMGGRMLLVGTRMATVDLYSEILQPKYYSDGKSPWTYLTQPAVLKFADDPKDWVTLWPETNRPPVSKAARNQAMKEGWPRNGMWPAWPGPALARKRSRMAPRNWSMVYMQDQVADDAVFRQEDVQGCVDRARYPGRMFDGQSDHRRYGMDGLTVVAGLDPAAAGCTAMVVVGLDRRTGQRWVLDVINERGMPPHRMRDEIKRLTERYGIQEWRIEKNAYQASITQDAEIRTYLNARGCLLTPHHTNSNKWDSDFGVASMATLFTGWQEGRNLIRLPSQTQSEGVRA